jgi:hypothetical protein
MDMKAAKMNYRITRLESELSYAREAYRYWARQECELTSDERLQKSRALSEVYRLERCLLAESRGGVVR